jgi:predicted nucleic acid-binding protein
MIVDTSGLFAFFHADERAHVATRQAIEASEEDLVISPFVLAELDYLVAKRLGTTAELEVLRELAGGAYLHAIFTEDDLTVAANLVERYRDQDVGLTDASLVVLADRYQTKAIVTLDRRHFDVMRPLAGGRFKIVP